MAGCLVFFENGKLPPPQWCKAIELRGEEAVLLSRRIWIGGGAVGWPCETPTLCPLPTREHSPCLFLYAPHSAARLLFNLENPQGQGGQGWKWTLGLGVPRKPES